MMTTPVANQNISFEDATEVARKTLHQLVSKRVAPTPENYCQVYREIAGIDSATPSTPPQMENIAWGSVITELIKQLEARQVGWTAARKRKSLDRVLATPSPVVLHNRIIALIQSWSRSESSIGVPDLEVCSFASSAPLASMEASAPEINRTAIPPADVAYEFEIIASLRERFADILESVIAAQLEPDKALVAEANALAARIRQLDDRNKLPKLTRDLEKFRIHLDKRLKNDSGLRDGVLRLLSLLLDNIHELVVDDNWLQGQLALVRQVLADPDDIHLIEEAERALKEIVFKQAVLKHSLNDAKSTLKDMVSHFINQLDEMSQSTGFYHDKLKYYSKVIHETDDIATLSKVFDELRHETQQIQLDTQRSRDAIVTVRTRVEDADNKIRHLEAELVKASELVREDQLTGVLNRRGLDDAFQRELSRSKRNHSPLSIALLDLDNFKRLNDAHGHQAGDQALVHMAKLVKATVRPHDIIARYGGEEFLILLPDTRIEEAENVIKRLQRSLTKHFFLNNNERLLITFSAGVALQRPGETKESLVSRADDALYEAKRAGKNRVFTAPLIDPTPQDMPRIKN
ncbi:putative Diguanylate cyclase [Georgfuchsia toluolica]|uniref:diguanylate cyclase n=1 Tax=Georgfuchsia toluolica TaxID=424218 RepID=A0A916J1Q6_9PROT|nr:diguanylate cyclase [Georgfuchsia toluolica]CAG4882211.1 putative Diguanylate cyclase [Georgfuchsia toluolica]